MAYTLEIRHDRMTADRWQVLLRVNRTAFAIGAECATLKEAQDLRTAFKTALFELGISMHNAEGESRAASARTLHHLVGDSEL